MRTVVKFRQIIKLFNRNLAVNRTVLFILFVKCDYIKNVKNLIKIKHFL